MLKQLLVSYCINSEFGDVFVSWSKEIDTFAGYQAFKEKVANLVVGGNVAKLTIINIINLSRL